MSEHESLWNSLIEGDEPYEYQPNQQHQQNQTKSPIKKRAKRKRETNPDETPAICEFCKRPSTLKIGVKSYLINSKSRPDLKICNACKSYEYRHGVLVEREKRQKNGRMNRRKRGLGKKTKKKQQDEFYVVKENEQFGHKENLHQSGIGRHSPVDVDPIRCSYGNDGSGNFELFNPLDTYGDGGISPTTSGGIASSSCTTGSQFLNYYMNDNSRDVVLRRYRDIPLAVSPKRSYNIPRIPTNNSLGMTNVPPLSPQLDENSFESSGRMLEQPATDYGTQNTYTRNKFQNLLNTLLMKTQPATEGEINSETRQTTNSSFLNNLPSIDDAEISNFYSPYNNSHQPISSSNIPLPPPCDFGREMDKEEFSSSHSYDTR